MRSLSQAEAVDRAAAIAVESYEIHLDVTTDDVFRSRVTARFTAARPGSATFVELKPVRLHTVTLNGAPLDPAGLDGNRLVLPDLAAANVLTVEADMAYSNSSEGLHRFVDPADGGVYLHATSFLDEAQRIFACFDQPDLKAPVTMRVTAPDGWRVAANGAVASSVSAGATTTWEFRPTVPLATYLVSVIAGPYHAVESTHDGIPLALYCTAALAQHLDKDADEIFEITRQCLDRFHELFGVRYPFGKFDQAFVPEFNAGGMENAGLVTIRDDYVFRSAVTDSERELRATTIAHELAHMWVGDLVTMRWWDDLWLNESFAEYLGYRVTAEATRFREAWTTFGMRRKGWGYAADQRPSTHPVAPSRVPDSAAALANFDGISYAKGAAVLRQLAAWVGDEAFLAGIRAHIAAHAFGNATLRDLLDALSMASGRDLSAWEALWLRESGVDTLRLAASVIDGQYDGVAVVRSGGVPRPHRVGLGVYDQAPDGSVVLRRRFEVDVEGARTDVPALRSSPVAGLLLLNDGDLTFAKVRLDDASAGAVSRVLPALGDPLGRAVLWTSMLDAVRDAERPVSDLVDLLVAALPAETEVIVLEDALLLARNLIDRYLPPAARSAALARVAAACADLVAAPGTADSCRLAAMRALVGASVDSGRLLGWLDGAGVPDRIGVDTELRWRVVYRLAVLGAIDDGRIDAELAADRSAAGEQWAARARAARPSASAKAAAWDVLINGDALSNRLLEANGQGFFQPEQLSLTAPYVERYFTELPAVFGRRTPYSAERLADLAFPRYAVDPRTRDLAAALLARDDVLPGVRRVVIDNDDDLRLALAARAR